MKIIYNDNNVIASYKPSGMLSQRSEKSSEESIVELLELECGCEVFPVHRLDRLTSGIMLFGKNNKSAAILSEMFENKKIFKEYLAVVSGKTESEGHMECHMFFDRKKDKSFVQNGNKRNGKKAILDYVKLSDFQYKGRDCTFIKVMPRTGRTHQIRLQLANDGHPIFGDGKYGSRVNGCSCALHAYKLGFDDVEPLKQLEDFYEKIKNNPDVLTCLPNEVFPWNCININELI